MIGFVILSMFLMICIANVLMYIVTTKIGRKEFYDYELGETGLEVKTLYPTATLWQSVTLIIDFLFTLSVLKGFYWNMFFTLIVSVISIIFILVILFFYKNYSETKLEQKQGYLSAINLLNLVMGTIIAAISL